MPHTLDLTTFSLGVDTKQVCVLITTIKRLLYVMCGCWQDPKAPRDPLDAQQSSPVPRPALPSAARSRMPLP